MPAYPLFDYNKIAKAYKVFGSTRKVARIIGCSNYTVCMVARKYGLKPTATGFTPENSWHGGMTGLVNRWAKKHPDVVIPLKPKEIEKVVGCRRSDAYHYLEGRRRTFMMKLSRLPDLSKFLAEPYTLLPDKKHFRLKILLTSSKRTIILYEDELDAILERLTAKTTEVK